MDKSKFLCVGEIVELSLLNIMSYGERMEMVNSFNYLGSCFSSDIGVKEDESGWENVERWEYYCKGEERYMWKNSSTDFSLWVWILGHVSWGKRQDGCGSDEVSEKYVWGSGIVLMSPPPVLKFVLYMRRKLTYLGILLIFAVKQERLPAPVFPGCNRILPPFPFLSFSR